MDFKKLYQDIILVSVNLFKIMIPTLILVKICQEFGVDLWLADVMGPLMSLMDLPAELAIILTTTMLTNPYAGLIVASSIDEMALLSVGQMSILGLFMLLTHSLPIEVMISRRTGVRARVTLLVRIGGGFICCISLAMILKATGWLQEPAIMAIGEFTVKDDFASWLWGQLLSLVMIQIIIIILLTFLEILRLIKVEALIKWMLSPLLRMIGIGERASTIAIVGVTLGLGFGGGLLIKDVETGTISKKDVFGVVCLINLLHSVFEDTAIILLMGPSLTVVLGFRFIFAIAMTFIILGALRRLPDPIWHRYLTNHNIPKSAG